MSRKTVQRFWDSDMRKNKDLECRASMGRAKDACLMTIDASCKKRSAGAGSPRHGRSDV